MKINMAPDSHRYLAMGNGERVARPFNRRVLLPFLCGSDVLHWQWLSYSCLFLLPVLTGVYVHYHMNAWIPALFAALLMAGLPQIQFWLKTPVLTDQFGITMALLAAVLPWPWNLIVCTVAAFGRETVPIFAAIYSWDPVLLAALVPIGLWSLVAPKGPDQLGRDNWLAHPVENSMKFHKDAWRHIGVMLLPWGAGIMSLCFMSMQMFAACLVAYAQMIVATDSARLFVWAAPVVFLQLAQVDPQWMGLLVVLHWLNPWRGNGA